MKRTKSRRNNHGFTLVELIIVIVIILVLAAVLVPTLLRYVQKARDAQMTEECRMCVSTAQALYTEHYPQDISEITYDAIKKDASVPGDITSIETDESYNILHLAYERDGRTITYCARYATCTLHEQMYTFEDSSGGGGSSTPALDPIKNFKVGDYIVTVDGKLEDNLKRSLQPGELFYYNGDYYIVHTQSWLQDLNNITASGGVVKINSQEIVPASSANKGDFAIVDGKLCVCTAKWGSREWREVKTEN